MQHINRLPMSGFEKLKRHSAVRVYMCVRAERLFASLARGVLQCQIKVSIMQQKAHTGGFAGGRTDGRGGINFISNSEAAFSILCSAQQLKTLGPPPPCAATAGVLANLDANKKQQRC